VGNATKGRAHLEGHGIVSHQSAPEIIPTAVKPDKHTYHCGVCGALLRLDDLAGHGCQSAAGLHPAQYADLFWEEV
jgi:hypothetical protein